MKFNEKLITLRKRKGLSQEEFAYEMGVSRQSVFKWESGENTPDVEKIKKIAKYYFVSLDILLDDNLDLAEAEAIHTKLGQHKPNDTHAEESFKVVSKIRNNSSLITIGILLLVICFFIIIFSFLFIENLLFKYITIGVFIFIGSFGFTLLFLSTLTRNDYILVTNEGVSGISFGKKFTYEFDKIKSARVLNQTFSSIAIGIYNANRETVVWRLTDPDTIVNKINAVLRKENSL